MEKFNMSIVTPSNQLKDSPRTHKWSHPLQSIVEALQPYAIREVKAGSFVSRCPVHSSPRTPDRPLMITQGDRGQILLHCFGGCNTNDVLHGIGLGFSDLFPERLTHHTTPEQRARINELALKSRLIASATTLTYETSVLLIGVQAQESGTPLTEEDFARMNEAQERITTIKATLSHL
jgi:hypothetical protein